MTGIFALYLIFAARLAFPSRFDPVTERPRANTLRNIGGAAIDLFSGQTGVGGGILANIFISLSGMPMNRRVILHAEPK